MSVESTSKKLDSGQQHHQHDFSHTYAQIASEQWQPKSSSAPGGKGDSPAPQPKKEEPKEIDLGCYDGPAGPHDADKPECSPEHPPRRP